MKVIVADSAGFCPGVARAVDIAERALAAGKLVWAEGPLIHNEQVVEKLRELGLDASPDGPSPEQAVLVRAHGAHAGKRRVWENAGHEILDATCPHVARNQELVETALAAGKTVIMAGDPGHAEVEAVLGPPGDRALLITSVRDIRNLDFPESEPLLLLAQTTFNAARFDAIAAAILERFPDAVVRRTICGETARRQEEARALAGRVDAMVVVGGAKSANTRRLAEVSAEIGVPTQVVETADDIDRQSFAACRTVGVIAGASTPDRIIGEVARALRAISAPLPPRAAGVRP